MLSAEVILPRRAHAQPSPRRVALGDCGACALGGLLGITVDQTYTLVCGPRSFPLPSGPQSIGWQTMCEVVEASETAGRLSRALVDIPHWNVGGAHMTWGLSAMWQSRPWWKLAMTAMDAGLYGLACVSSVGGGADSEGPDHWVLIVGYRVRVESPGGDSEREHRELLVSCSARHPEGKWVGRREFLEKWGGFNTIWARPA